MAQDVSKKELEKMGFKSFRTTGDGLTIHPDDVAAFIEYDKRPPTKEELEHLRHCVRVFRGIKKRDTSKQKDTQSDEGN